MFKTMVYKSSFIFKILMNQKDVILYYIENVT